MANITSETVQGCWAFEDIPIIDSHIHLFPASELETLAWNTPSHELWSQHGIPEYLESVYSPIKSEAGTNLKGFIFIESDRKTDLFDIEAWNSGPLLELRYIIAIANGSLQEADGYNPNGSKLLLGIIPWAPIPAGVAVLEDYVSRAKAIAGDKWYLVKGFRYLLQDKPAGTMLQPDFIAGMKYLGENGFVFDLGVDFRSGGAWQLDEVLELMERLKDRGDQGKVGKIIVNHMCKPPMDCESTSDAPIDQFGAWQSRMQAIAQHENILVKISGGFSEIQALPKYGTPEVKRLELLDMATSRISNFIDVTYEAFGPDRCIFASDWPVCNIGGGGTQVAWNDWLTIVRKWFQTRDLPKENQEKLFWKNAKQAYSMD